MANISAAAPLAPGEFRIGDVFSKTATLLSRHFLIFFVVALVAALPRLLWSGAEDQSAANFPWGRLLLGFALFLILNTLAQAVIVYGAFQAMRGRAVNLSECLRVGLGRLFPIIGLVICAYLAIWIGLILLIIPGIILGIMWYVATPVCVVSSPEKAELLHEVARKIRERSGKQHDGRREHHRGERKRPPEENERGPAVAEPREDFGSQPFVSTSRSPYPWR